MYCVCIAGWKIKHNKSRAKADKTKYEHYKILKVELSVTKLKELPAQRVQSIHNIIFEYN